jgi:superfamily I DNA and/or RNA helicase
VSEVNKAGSGTLEFFREVTKYFMDFLETDFHKQRLPKRTIKSRNSGNLLIGFNLKKYESFQQVIEKHIAGNFPADTTLQVKKAQHKTKLPKNVLDLIELQISKISKTDFSNLIEEIAVRIEQEAVLNKDDFEFALNNACDNASASYYNLIIHPFILSLEKPLTNKELGDDSDIFMMEQELVEAFVERIQAKISDLLKRLFAKEKPKLSTELQETISLVEVQALLVERFSEMKVADLFDEVKDLENNKAILDKQDFYLYFGDIAYKGNKYPIFYLPINLVKLQESFQLEFDAQVYINKKALEYIAQEFNKDRGTRGTLKSIGERIIYLSQHQTDLQDVLGSVISEIQNFFEMRDNVNFHQQKEMKAKGAEVSISNSLYFSLFDKSDEALVNDYEEILTQIGLEGGDLSEAFQQILDDFLQNNPESISSEVEDEWDSTDTPSKLVAQSPIPLNSEQLQILSAIKKPNCKYVIVEGPPGTGKSHTITAIIFDAILNSKSILVLSDKKEALDVVEKNITETMNKVRLDQNFQNPILRLGKTGNTYSQILSKTAITGIKAHYRGVKANLADLDETISQATNSLKEDIELETLSYGDVDIQEVKELMYLEENIGNPKTFYFDLDEVLSNEMGGYDIGTLKEGLNSFNSVTSSKLFKRLSKLLGHNPTDFEDYIDLLESLDLVAKASTSLVDNRLFALESIRRFESFSKSDIPKLRDYLNEYRSKKMFIFGYAFSKGALNQISSRFRNDFKFIGENPHTLLPTLESALVSFNLMAEKANKINADLQLENDFVALLHQIFLSEELKDWLAEVASTVEIASDLNSISTQYPKSFKKLAISVDKLETLSDNKLVNADEAKLNEQIRYVQLKKKVSSEFTKIPNLDYQSVKKSIEQLVITKVAHKLDGRVIDFYENNKNDAETLRAIIRGKQKFPRDKFEKLNNAFPCILAGIRDYAEYIPLNHQMFDLLIIDEASQVSLAQAFPALIRAKKVLILGDRKQFSNIKSAQARSDTNRDYLSRLEGSFKASVSKDPSQLVRLGKFDIKTSVLEFFEFISNYSMQLTKHFRGYKEIISYSNKHFYRNSLQVMKIRAKNIDEVIKFTRVTASAKDELRPNSNSAEVDFIKSELLRLRVEKSEQSVGIITPHTNQQKLLVDQISKMPEYDYFVDNFKLKIMTFDTCQGEERDTIYYSMVATKESDKLWGVFIKDLSNVDIEEDGQIKAQRLNVGFSRGKECIHFVISKDIEDFNGSVGEALRHYKLVLDEALEERKVSETDQRSGMEPEVLNWFYQTDFWNKNKKAITFIPSFEIGKYLKQLDPTYTHPMYKVDFLLAYKDSDDKERKIVIEYDGFEEHFKNRDQVDEYNYEHYMSDGDVYRQKVLESYGYKFLRINKFNSGSNPVETLDKRLKDFTKPELKTNPWLSKIHTTIEDIQSGDLKECPKCKELRDVDDFKDASLSRGVGRICKHCKTSSGTTRSSRSSSAVTSGTNCPKCGSRMVRRSSRYGSFYGCSKYPYCKGKR